MTKSRFRTARRLLIFWTLFIGLGAVAGASGMLLDPTGAAMGMDTMLPFFQVLPFSDLLFRDLFFSGIALLVVNGLTNLTAAALLLMKKRIGIVLGGVFGVTLMLWICIQFYMFPANFMSTAYFVFGFCQAATGYAAYVFDRQERFRETIPPRPAPTDPTKLVVYFSRMGYGEKIACETAKKTGAELYEIRSTERTEGTAGFWWCGRFGMHRWEMPVVPGPEDLEKYEHVTIVTPVWVFALAAPVRAFCRQAAGKIRTVDIVSVHFSRGRYENVSAEIDRLLGIRHTAYTSVRCRMGTMTLERGKE
ncbi:MAG: hypothetical protein Q4C53_03180 [Clostridia bacterium]|nr:hypothetical protein [Clostridia bacterium]